MAASACRRWLAPLSFWLHAALLYPLIFLNTTGDMSDVDPAIATAFLRIVVAVLVSGVVGPFWASTLFRLARTAGATRLMFTSQGVASSLLVLHGILLCVWGVVSLGVMCFLVAAADWVWMRRAVGRVAYLNDLLQLTVGLLTMDYKWVGLVTIATVVQTGFLFMWTSALVRVLALPPTSTTVFAVVCLLLSLRWTHGVIKHTVTVVVAGFVVQVMSARAMAAAADNATVRQRAGSLTLAVEEGGGGGADDDEEADADVMGLAAAVAKQPVASTAAAPPRPPQPLTAPAGGPATITAATDNAARAHNGATTAASPAWEEGGDAHAAVPAPALPAPALIHHPSMEHMAAIALRRHHGAIVTGSLFGIVSPLMWWCRRAGRAGVAWGRQTVLQGAGSPTTPPTTAVQGPSAAPPVRLSVWLGVAPAPRGSACNCCRSVAQWLAVVVGALLWRMSDAYLARSHKYTFVSIATHGRPWLPSARKLWASFARSGVDGVIDDDVTDRLLVFGGYVGGAVLALLLAGTLSTPFLSLWLLIALVVFSMGFMQVTLPLAPLEAAVSTNFVTFAQAPELLAVLHPLIFHRYLRLSELYLLNRRHAGGRGGAGVGGGGGRHVGAGVAGPQPGAAGSAVASTGFDDVITYSFDAGEDDGL